MNRNDAAKEIKELTEALTRHNYLYYVENNPEISDYDFDMMLKRLNGLESEFPDLADENSPTKRVGGDITKKFETVIHKSIRTIPLILKGDFPKDFEIRGEIYFPLDKFNQLNENRRGEGEAEFANPRNTASGTLKMQDSSVVAERGLDCVLYGVYGTGNLREGHFETVKKVGDWGFKTPDEKKRYIEKTNSLEGINDFIAYWDKKRNDLPFVIDGVVIKVNQYHYQEDLGFTAKSPRWAIAYKFKTERVETILESVDFQVGRTGAITPVANLKPIQLGGTTVKRASLYNADQIEKLDLHMNDAVYVEKGGEIIPKIVGINLEKRTAASEAVKFIEECPECKTKLVRFEGEVNYYCPNDSGCSPQMKGKIEHFISRRAMNIDGLGAETVDALFEKGLIKNVADLYDLTYDQVIEMERMADKSARNLIDGIKASKEMPFVKVLFGLGIRFVGETVAKKLAQALKSMDALSNASYDELVGIEEIGEKIAISIQEYFRDERNQEIIRRIAEHGLKMEVEVKEKTSSVLDGQAFVVSGVFSAFSRDELKEMIEMNGGKVIGSISSKTSFVVAGDKMGPSKLQKATELGVPILSEDEFIAMLKV